MSQKGQIQIAVGGFYGEIFKNSPATSPDYLLVMESSKRAGLNPSLTPTAIIKKRIKKCKIFCLILQCFV